MRCIFLLSGAGRAGDRGEAIGSIMAAVLVVRRQPELDEHIEPDMHSDRRTRAGRADDRGIRVQVTLQLDHRLLEQVDAAARHRATSRVALVAAWLAEKLGQEPAETDRQR